MHNRLLKLTLGLLLLFVTPNITAVAAVNSNENEREGATHAARVISARAIVYSDESMNSPLGYISNDRLIMVGNPRKKNPELVPLVVYGRLAFIEARNLHYENESVEIQNAKRGAPREHNIDLVLARPEEKLSENNSVYFDLHQFNTGEDTKTLFQTIDGTEKSGLSGIGVTLLHRNQNSRLLWGAAFEYNSTSSSAIDLKMTLMRAILGYTPIRTPLFLVDLGGALDVAPSITLLIKTNSVDEPNGFAYGASAHARIVFFPENTYHLFGTLGLRSYKVINLENLVDANSVPVNGISKMGGIDLSIGFAMEI